MGDLFFDLSPIQSAFVHSDAQVVMLMGSMGEGKTYAGGVAIVRHAARCWVPIRAAIIRDTHQNLKLSTVPDLQRMFGRFVHFHDDFKRMVIDCVPRVECDLFGIDDPASLSKLQGPQYAMIWLEEPAPIVEKANAGLPRDVFDLAMARAARQAGTAMRVQITQNPADENHWTEDLFMAPAVMIENLETGGRILKDCFRIPYKDNKYLNQHARDANKVAFANDPGKFARYVEGRAAPVNRGCAVTPEYNAKIHFTESILPVVPGALGVRGYDAWHHPCIIVSQYINPGRLIVHDVLCGDGCAIEEMIDGPLLTLLSTPKYCAVGKPKIGDWRDIGDPSMRTPDQSSVQRTTARLLEDKLKTRFEPGPVKLAARLNPLKSALLRLAPDGNPLVVVSRSAYPLHRALNGGWHFKKDNSGNIIGTQPEKDAHSHVGDAFSYLVAQVFPFRRERATKSETSARNVRAKSLAESYGHSRHTSGGYLQ
ncbi:MAG: hypothetical protein HZB23_03645 [Deltaproteobacteria bacterium]|nr:hypothetical protein [Deltaproteobacteria bacterium]